MPIEQVKIPKALLPLAKENQQMKITRGKIGLYIGNFAKIKIWASKGDKPLLLFRKGDGGKWICARKFGFNEITLANDTARRLEAQGNAHSARLGTLSDDEQAAVKLWRDYAFEQYTAGTPARKLSDVMRDLIDRETHKDDTPLFSAVAFDFLEYKERRASLSESYYTQTKSRLKALSESFRDKRLSEIHESDLEKAIVRAVKPRRDDTVPAQKTVKHWLALVSELFAWWFNRENAKRPARDRLTNPLEALKLPKIEKEKEPEIISVADARAILADLWEHAPRAVPAVAIQLFCGVRNLEALRLRWRDIIDGEIRLSLSITKTKISRTVPVSENLAKWLDAFRALHGVPVSNALIFAGADTPESELSTLPRDARKRKEYENEMKRRDAYGRIMRASFARVGIAKTQNAFRHTAVSCLVKIYDESRASSFCGHSVYTQGVFYRTAVTAQDAKDFFAILPPNIDSKLVAFDRSRNATAPICPPKDENGTMNAIGNTASA